MASGDRTCPVRCIRPRTSEHRCTTAADVELRSVSVSTSQVGQRGVENQYSKMPSKVTERAVTEFLRDALAADGLGVSKLNAMARAAGLLGERQRITQAKSFRRAKDALGIRSVREGFGAGGRWGWELPRSSEGKAPTP